MSRLEPAAVLVAAVEAPEGLASSFFFLLPLIRGKYDITRLLFKVVYIKC